MKQMWQCDICLRIYGNYFEGDLCEETHEHGTEGREMDAIRDSMVNHEIKSGEAWRLWQGLLTATHLQTYRTVILGEDGGVQVG